MKNYRRTLPPLDYLLFFEAAARHGNFTKAASELNVSQAAVSKRVKFLEDWLGIELVTRRGRSINLSRNGQKLAASASEALDYMNLCVTQLRQTNHEKLSLASNVAVSQFWLTPRINEYLLGRDAVPVTLTASDKDSDLFNQENDAIVYYGSDIPTGWDGAVLFDEIWQPVAAPDLPGLGSDLDAITLLDFEKLTPKWINWPDFTELTGKSDFAGASRVNLGSYGSSLDAAIRGKGIALGCPDVLRYEIDAGRLISLDEFRLRTGRTYFAIWKTGTMTQRTRELLQDVGIRF
jgi:DNA-binding transcriptional LysR family regulator